MSNRRFQLALDTTAQGHHLNVLPGAVVSQLLNVIVISIVIVVAIIQSPLADWTT